MTEPKVFLTGATGYIGGDVLFNLVEHHPHYQVTCLVRDSEIGAQVASQYAKVRLVYGNLEDSSLLEEEARKADVVLNCADADHVDALRALTAGLAAHPPSSPGYLIHTSGGGLLLAEGAVFGGTTEKVYDDWDGLAEVLNLPDTSLHRPAEKIVFAAGEQHPDRIQTAIVNPPCIYGIGRGPGKQRSFQIPEYARAILRRGRGFIVGEGRAQWSGVHIHDLSDLYVILTEYALVGTRDPPSDKARWGPTQGYYFAENGVITFGHIARALTSAAHKHGFLPDPATPDPDPLPTRDQTALVHPWGPLIWGANSRSRALRARNLLAWTPKHTLDSSSSSSSSSSSFNRLLEDTLMIEAKSLGLIKGHAKEAAGEA